MDNPEKLTPLGTQDTGRLVYPMLSVSLDCPLLISPLVFSKVYLLQSVLCLVYPMLSVSLDCPFLISPLVFSKVYSLQSVLCLVYPMLSVSLIQRN
jgi:hypothetical protein